MTTPPPPPPSASRALAGALDAVSVNHLMHIVRTVGQISDDDVARHMGTARAIHAAEMDANPHPMDASLPVDAHEWVAQRIAINLVARERGYNLERVIAAQERARQVQHQRPDEPILRPMRTTADA